MTRRMPVLLLMLALLAACAPGTPTVVPPTETAAPPAAGLDLDQVLGSRYQPYDGTLSPVQLVNGISQQADPPMRFALMEDWVAFGDLDGDGDGDAAALLVENFGGTGQFVFLVAWLYQAGQPLQLRPVLLGDRVQPQGLRIDSGLVVLDLLVQGPSDPLCCPTVPNTWTYLLLERQLVLLRSSSRTPLGQERAIVITRPLMGESAAQSVRLTGNVTIAPFENNLACRVYSGNDLVLELPLMVSAPDMGAPGTFDAQIDLSAVPAGLVRIEVLDISMADGATLASDSVLFFDQ